MSDNLKVDITLDDKRADVLFNKVINRETFDEKDFDNMNKLQIVKLVSLLDMEIRRIKNNK